MLGRILSTPGCCTAFSATSRAFRTGDSGCVRGLVKPHAPRQGDEPCLLQAYMNTFFLLYTQLWSVRGVCRAWRAAALDIALADTAGSRQRRCGGWERGWCMLYIESAANYSFKRA